MAFPAFTLPNYWIAIFSFLLYTLYLSNAYGLYMIIANSLECVYRSEKNLKEEEEKAFRIIATFGQETFFISKVLEILNDT